VAISASESGERWIRDVARGIDGWLTDDEARYLWALAGAGPGRGVVVEIGSSRGKSTVVLAAASRAAGREGVVAIDPHLHHASEATFRANVARAGLGELVRPLVMRSDEAVVGWREPIRLLWIDGAHDYDSVRADWEGWAPFVVAGGVIAFHDTFSWDGPRRLVEEVLFQRRDLAVIGIVDSITAFRTVGAPTAAARLRSAAFRRLRRLHELGRQRRLPGELRRAVRWTLRALSRAATPRAR